MVNAGLWRVLIVASMLLATAPLHPLAAGTVSGTMAVGATVEESCRVDTQPMVFGSLPETHGTREAQSSLSLQCTPAASYLVIMDHGGHGDGEVRRMADSSGKHFLAYDIFTDPARTRRWGTSPSSAVSAVAPADGKVELAVYGRLGAGLAPVGEYRDTVTITVEF